ncbi:DUF2093 domain-containing protein [Bartonella sp. HY038]|uniref:DUF2093 domain-containing protein n=1 Tax=Bartonella sp. HY038 TaxID=2759660 RepID=UPI00352E7007
MNNLRGNEAKLQYKGGDYVIEIPGTYVLCAVSREKIPLDDLSYWNVERQEAYASCQISYERELECNPHLRDVLTNT